VELNVPLLFFTEPVKGYFCNTTTHRRVDRENKKPPLQAQTRTDRLPPATSHNHGLDSTHALLAP
jgi:hypothetical protein